MAYGKFGAINMQVSSKKKKPLPGSALVEETVPTGEVRGQVDRSANGMTASTPKGNYF